MDSAGFVDFLSVGKTLTITRQPILTLLTLTQKDMSLTWLIKCDHLVMCLDVVLQFLKMLLLAE
jgi:hypothetical protein